MEQKGPTEICWKLILEMAGAEAWAEDKAGAEAGAEAKAFLRHFTSTRLVIFSSTFHQHTFGVFFF